MGVTINYRGNLNNKRQVHEFIGEVRDICDSMDWKYTLLDEDWNKPAQMNISDREEGGVHFEGHAGLKGIIFQPHKDCDGVALTFDKNGRLNSLINLAFGTKPGEGELPWVFTKTQFAGAEVHISIVKLLKYLKKKYIANLEVMDEGNYWDTGDHKEVMARMEVINRTMEAIEKGLAELDENSELTKEAIMKKIEEIMRQIGEQEGVEVKVLRIDKILEERDFDPDTDLPGPSLN